MNRTAEVSAASLDLADVENLTIGTVENLARIHDDLTLTIKREPRSPDDPLAEHERRWVGQLRRIGAAKLRYWGLPSLVDDIELATSELVTNALLHATGDHVGFRMLLSSDLVVTEVDDGSSGHAHIRAAGLEDESGRGISIVRAISTLCGVSPDGRKTWCAFTLPPGFRGA